MASPARPDAAPAPPAPAGSGRAATRNRTSSWPCSASTSFSSFSTIYCLWNSERSPRRPWLAGWQGCFLLCVLARRRLPGLWPAAQTGAVVLFVGWQLVFLCVRNSLDFWYTPLRHWCMKQEIWDHGVGPVLDPVNAAADRYANVNGIDQDWKMFAPPLARSDPFPAVRIVFTDGSDETVLSDNEPDPRGFFRFGGWRQRRLEDVVVWGRSPILSTAYVRWSVRRWRERHSGDPRTPERVVLLRREWGFPGPGTDPAALGPVEVSPIGEFLPDGSSVP